MWYYFHYDNWESPRPMSRRNNRGAPSSTPSRNPKLPARDCDLELAAIQCGAKFDKRYLETTQFSVVFCSSIPAASRRMDQSESIGRIGLHRREQGFEIRGRFFGHELILCFCHEDEFFR
jgi:hypothetical protein